MAPKTPAQKKASEKWEKKYKQRIIRIDPSLDDLLVNKAKEEGKSINSFIIDSILKEITSK